MIPPATLPPPTPEQTVEALAACGADAANIRIAYDEELQSDVVTIGSRSGVDQTKLPCIAGAVHPFYLVHFEDPATDAAYSTLVWEQARRRAALAGREWLRERGLLQGMPRFRPGKVPLTKFVRDVEVHCSVRPGRAIEIVTPSSVTLRSDFMESIVASDNRRHADRMTCLMNVLAASDLAAGGVAFGFVGSEAAEPDSGRR